MKYRNRIPEPGTTISGFADNKKKKKINPDRLTLYFFDMWSKHIYIYFFASMIYHTRGKYFNLYTTDEEVKPTKIHRVSHTYMIQGFIADGLYLTVIIKYFYRIQYS